MRAERQILLRFLNALTSLNGFIIKRIVFLLLVKYIARGTLMRCESIILMDFLNGDSFGGSRCEIQQSDMIYMYAKDQF
jgi:hypothetical protein